MPARKFSKLDALLKTPQPVPNRHEAKKAAKRKTGDAIELPADGNWRTTDEDETNRRRLRAREEALKVANLQPGHPLFSDFRVTSAKPPATT